jgi:predicted Rdx family selenoprotein
MDTANTTIIQSISFPVNVRLDMHALRRSTKGKLQASHKVGTTASIPVTVFGSFARTFASQENGFVSQISRQSGPAIYRVDPQDLAALLGSCSEFCEAEDLPKPIIDAVSDSLAPAVERNLALIEIPFGVAFVEGSGSSYELTAVQVLTPSYIPNEIVIEAHLPLANKYEWFERAKEFSSVEVTCAENGTLLIGRSGHKEDWCGYLISLAAHAVDLPWAGAKWVRFAKRGNAITPTILRHWFDTPLVMEGHFRHVYAAVSLAIQKTLREELPRLWQEDPQNAKSLEGAASILLYQASEPFVGSTCTALTYDPLDPASLQRFRRSAMKGLPAVLDRFQGWLMRQGRTHDANLFGPKRTEAVLRDATGGVKRILTGEVYLLETFIDFGIASAKARRRRSIDPAYASRDLAKVGEKFAKTLRNRLRKVCRAEHVDDLAMALLIATTSALRDYKENSSSPETPKEIIAA